MDPVLLLGFGVPLYMLWDYQYVLVSGFKIVYIKGSYTIWVDVRYPKFHPLILSLDMAI